MNELSISFDNEIAQTLEHEGCVIVLFHIPEGKVENRNICCVDEAGKILWEIEESPHGTQSDKPFMGVYFDKEKLIASNWNGVDYLVDLDTGKISTLQFPK